eukprot:1547704-Pleurochrysis_carterae.AAC.1
MALLMSTVSIDVDHEVRSLFCSVHTAEMLLAGPISRTDAAHLRNFVENWLKDAKVKSRTRASSSAGSKPYREVPTDPLVGTQREARLVSSQTTPSAPGPPASPPPPPPPPQQQQQPQPASIASALIWWEPLLYRPNWQPQPLAQNLCLIPSIGAVLDQCGS